VAPEAGRAPTDRGDTGDRRQAPETIAAGTPASDATTPASTSPSDGPVAQVAIAIRPSLPR
jgi:hypothetical protein